MTFQITVDYQLTSVTCPDLDVVHGVRPAQVHLPPGVRVVDIFRTIQDHVGVDTVRGIVP